MFDNIFSSVITILTFTMPALDIVNNLLYLTLYCFCCFFYNYTI